MVVAKGKIKINAAIGINLSDEDKGIGKPGDPINISPDVIYGVMPKLDVGIYHTNQGLTGFYFEGLGGGLCVRRGRLSDDRAGHHRRSLSVSRAGGSRLTRVLGLFRSRRLRSG